MCKHCWERIVKSDRDEFLDSLELTHAERAVVEELYQLGEERMMEILERQGKELQVKIEELSEEYQVDIGALGKALTSLQRGELCTVQFEQAVYEAFMPLFHVAGETELVAWNKEKTWSIQNKGASRFALRVEKLVPEMNRTSKKMMKRCFQKAIEEGKTISERAQLIREISARVARGEAGPFSMERAVRIARTMSTAAANGGKLEGWKQSEVVTGKKWRAANQARTRKSHREANGQERALHEKFEVGKSQLMYPGDPKGEAKEIIHCRCSMQAVMD